MRHLFKQISSILFPVLCTGCQSHLLALEDTICVKCRHQLPYTNFNFTEANPIHNVLKGRANIKLGAALFWYEKGGIAQTLLHQLKYKHQEGIGIVFGEILGSKLATLEAYKNIDIIIPVPLHPKRMKQRGYNQVAKFGNHLAKHLHATYEDCILKKRKHTKTQTDKSRFSRWQTLVDSFEVSNTSILANRHVLLIDDVITTGATLEACILTLQEIPNLTVSIATMSIVR